MKTTLIIQLPDRQIEVSNSLPSIGDWYFASDWQQMYKCTDVRDNRVYSNDTASPLHLCKRVRAASPKIGDLPELSSPDFIPVPPHHQYTTRLKTVNDSIRLARNIKTIRCYLGLTQSEFGRKTGLYGRALELERGRLTVTEEDLRAISELSQVPLSLIRDKTLQTSINAY